ncbi:MAG: GNAT family N-acetyltransferase [Bacteroidota bacterium]
MTETERLILKPLNYSQLVNYIKADHSLEAELNLNQSPRAISPELKEALENTILPNVADPNKNYLYSTLWTIISKEEKIMVGDLCFVGEPDGDGGVEIGYGTYLASRNKGYMTEAVGGLVKWAEGQPEINYISADTEKNNIASFSVLEKNGFTRVGETDTLYKWRLQIARHIDT